MGTNLRLARPFSSHTSSQDDLLLLRSQLKSPDIRCLIIPYKNHKLFVFKIPKFLEHEGQKVSEFFGSLVQYKCSGSSQAWVTTGKR